MVSVPLSNRSYLAVVGLAVMIVGASCVSSAPPSDQPGAAEDEAPTLLEAPAKCRKNADCGLCQRCHNKRCENQGKGQDSKHECSAGSCRTGKCDGHGACGTKPDGTVCGTMMSCRAGTCSVPPAPDAGAEVGPEAGSDASEAGDASDSPPEIELGATELIFSAIRGTRSVERALVVRNTGAGPLHLTSSVVGQSASAFVIVGGATPQTVPAGGQVTLRLAFAPAATATLGVHQAALRISSDDADEAILDVGLFGLATKGAQGGNEPPLKQVVDTLGYAINVGGIALELGTGAGPIGDEVRAQRFKRASAGPVTLRPVARYSPDEPIPYGIYTGSGPAPTFQRFGVIQTGQEQTLLPAVQAGAVDAIDPGDVDFGVFTTSKAHTTFTEDARNTGAIVHAVRSYPLKDRAGNSVAGAFLIGFEEAKNGDYNDYVFVLGNVTPVP
jgi:hypothetical protein